MSENHDQTPLGEAEMSVLQSPITRRKALRAAGVGVAAAAALTVPGFSGSEASAAGKVREFHSAWPYVAPPTGHFNEYSSDGNVILGGSIYDDLLQMPFAKYVWATGSWVPYMASSWKLTKPATFTVNLRKGAKWSDGTEFTAQDVMTTFVLRRLTAHSEWNYLDRMTSPNKYTVVFHMNKPANVVQRYILEANIVADSVYGKLARQVETVISSGKDLKSSSEAKGLRLQLDQYRPVGMVTSGPFMFDPATPITNGQITLVQNPNSWAVKQVKFDKIVDFNGETPAITPLVLQKQIDYATQGFPVATEKQFQKLGIHILRPPIYSGPALFINYNKVPAMAAKEVRQAIAYAINYEENALVSLGQSAKRCQYMAGVSDNLMNTWTSAADRAKLNSYAYNPKKAADMLTARSFKKGSDGVWVDPSGGKMEYTLEVPAEFADWSAAASNLAEQLTKFGIKTSVKAVTYTQVSPDVDKGNFQLAIQGWGAGSPFPQFSFFADVETHNPPVALGPGTGLKMLQGGVNLTDLVTATGQGLGESTPPAQRKAVARMAGVFNDLLPIIPLWERYGNNVALKNVRVAGWPPDSDPIYKNSPYSDSFVVMMIVSGQLRGV